MNIFLVILFIILITIVIYLFQYRPTKTTNIKELYAEGLDLLVSGKRQAAYKNFKEIVDKDSNNIKGYIRLGQVLREGGNVLKAIKIHKNLLIRKNVNSYELIELHKNLALDYYKINNYNHAIDECKEILKIDNNNEWAIHQLVIMYRNNNNWNEATEYLKKYFEKTGKNNNHKLALYKIQQSKIKIKDKDFEGARAILDKALNLKPDIASAYYFLAKTYSEESNIEYEKALKLESQNSSSMSNKNEYNQHIEQAKKILSKAIPLWVHFTEINLNQSWLVLPLLKDALFVLNRYSELENILIELNKNFPENIEILANLADYYSHKGEIDKALESISTVNEQDKSSLLIKLISIKLNMQKAGDVDLSKELDDSINILIRDQRYQFLNDSSTSLNDMKWLLEDYSDEINE